MQNDDNALFGGFRRGKNRPCISWAGYKVVRGGGDKAKEGIFVEHMQLLRDAASLSSLAWTTR